MLAVNYTNLRDNMKAYMDKVTDDYETMIVTRKDNKNVVMLSEEAYNNLMENVCLKKVNFLFRTLRRCLRMNKVFTDNGWKTGTINWKADRILEQTNK